MFINNAFHGGHGLTGAVAAGGFSGHQCGVEHVEAHDGAGSGGVVGGAERGYRYHGTFAAAYEKHVQVVSAGAVGGFGLYVHTVYAVEHVEVIDIY